MERLRGRCLVRLRAMKSWPAPVANGRGRSNQITGQKPAPHPHEGLAKCAGADPNVTRCWRLALHASKHLAKIPKTSTASPEGIHRMNLQRRTSSSPILMRFRRCRRGFRAEWTRLSYGGGASKVGFCNPHLPASPPLKTARTAP